jgi:hypothetical protein
MATENKFDKLRSMVHQGVPVEKPAQKTGQDKKEAESVSVGANAPAASETVTPSQSVESDKKEVKESVESAANTSEAVVKVPESPVKQAEKRKRKPQADYQSLFFSRIDFTHRKPLYITAATHRRMMRIVHLMDESKATISSYVENIILNHLDTFREEIDTIYRTNNINPTE